MKPNIGSYDIAARFVIGCLIGMWGIQVESLWGLIGLLPAITALTGFCPLYTLLHINTTRTDQ